MRLYLWKCLNNDDDKLVDPDDDYDLGSFKFMIMNQRFDYIFQDF